MVERAKISPGNHGVEPGRSWRHVERWLGRTRRSQKVPGGESKLKLLQDSNSSRATFTAEVLGENRRLARGKKARYDHSFQCQLQLKRQCNPRSHAIASKHKTLTSMSRRDLPSKFKPQALLGASISEHQQAIPPGSTADESGCSAPAPTVKLLVTTRSTKRTSVYTKDSIHAS